MKYQRRVPLAGVLAAGLLTLLLGQEAAGQESQSRPQFLVVNYMKSTEGGSEAYESLEKDVWKKVHEAKLKDGKSHGWIFYKVVRKGENAPEYDYVTIDLYDSSEQMESPYPEGYLSNVLSDDELTLVGQTAARRKLVGRSIWQIESGIMSDSAPSPEGMLVLANTMQPTEGNEDRYLAAETTAFQKLHQAKIDSGNMIAWFLLRSFSPNEEPATEFMTFDVYKDPAQARSRMSQEDRDAALESLTEQESEMVESMSSLRTLSNRDVWVTIDFALPNQDSSPELAANAVEGASESVGEWEKQEWSKLIGVWKATMPNGNYRIKHISQRQEVLERYNSEGELLDSMETDMKIKRYRGLNFFTVRIGTPREYTSIYKVHEGKWYEQLRGIFAEIDGVAPDSFIIYERIEE